MRLSLTARDNTKAALKTASKLGSLMRAVARVVSFLRSSKQKLLLIAVVVLATLAVSAVISALLSRTTNLNIPSIGAIYTIGVEAFGGDLQSEGESKYIDWGKTYTGTSTNRSFYLRSLSNVKAALKLDSANWTFKDSNGKVVEGPAGEYMDLEWNYDGRGVDRNETIEVALSLSISPSADFRSYLLVNDVKTFSFTIVIQTCKYGS